MSNNNAIPICSVSAIAPSLVQTGRNNRKDCIERLTNTFVSFIKKDYSYWNVTLRAVRLVVHRLVEKREHVAMPAHKLESLLECCKLQTAGM